MSQINEIVFLDRCDRIRKEIIKNREELKFCSFHESICREQYIKGMEYCYNLMKSMGIYK